MEFKDDSGLNEKAWNHVKYVLRYLADNTENPWEAIIVASGVIYEVCKIMQWDTKRVMEGIIKAEEASRDPSLEYKKKD